MDCGLIFGNVDYIGVLNEITNLGCYKRIKVILFKSRLYLSKSFRLRYFKILGVRLAVFF